LHPFFVKANNGFAIFAYPAMNLLYYPANPRNALTFVAILGVGKFWIVAIFLRLGLDPA
jgi:hypothetical protein